MEGLLPVIIALVVSAIISMRQKKAWQEEDPSFPHDESPWEDLMRELQTQTPDPSQPAPTPSRDASSASKPAAPATLPTRPLPEVRSSDDTPHEPISQELFSADSEGPEGKPAAPRGPVYEAEPKVATGQPIRSREGTVTSMTPDKTVQMPSLQQVETVKDPAMAAQTDEPDTPFESGFDPRMAVLYSEVFRPKYQD